MNSQFKYSIVFLLNGKWKKFKIDLERNQTNPIMLADYPELDYPATLEEAKLRLEQEESRMSRMVQTSQPKGRTYATVGANSNKRNKPVKSVGKGNGRKRGNDPNEGKSNYKKLLSQHTIPEDYKSHKFIKKSNNYGVFGRQLKS